MSAAAREFPKITVSNLQRAVAMDLVGLEKFATRAVQRCMKLRRHKLTQLAKLREIFMLLISDRRMAALHRQFLDQPGPTDVLTFEHGEIFISVQTARRHARFFGNSLTRELQLYIVHGLLHLHGFDDRKRTDARKMERTQEKV